MIDLWAIDDANLDVYQFRMMCHIARVGVCWKSIRTLADDCNMSVGKASETRKWLEENGYILKAKDGRSGHIGWSISSQFERSQDEQTQQNSSPDEQNVHDMNKTFTTRTKRSPHEHGRSPHEPKEVTIRQQLKEETEENNYKAYSNGSLYQNAFDAYQNEIGNITKMIGDSIQSWIDDTSEQWVVDAIGIASVNNKRNWAYAEAILKRWDKEGKQSFDKSKSNGHAPSGKMTAAQSYREVFGE